MELTCLKMRNNSAIYYVNTNGIFIKDGSSCIAETEHGIDLGVVMQKAPRCRFHGQEIKGKVIRLASEDDLKQVAVLEDLEKKAFEECRKKAVEKNLDMNLVNVKAIFDRSKIIFYFVAENRVDFRELVRDLASAFRTRIEMRQIGVRDKSRIVGGYGMCGEGLCCTKFRGTFSPVSIKMGKEQNLNLNSQKISGVCGRLLCCLDYEYAVYLDLNQNLPPQGAEIRAGDISCIVEAVETLKQTIRIRYKDNWISVHKDDMKFDGVNYYVSQHVIERILHHEDVEHEENL